MVEMWDEFGGSGTSPSWGAFAKGPGPPDPPMSIALSLATPSGWTSWVSDGL